MNEGSRQEEVLYPAIQKLMEGRGYTVIPQEAADRPNNRLRLRSLGSRLGGGRRRLGGG